MSTPPKDAAGTPRTPSRSGGGDTPHPKPGAGNALESTFLGVAPAAPEPPTTPPSSSAPAAGGASGGSAIIAAPMISVSGDRKPRPLSAAPAAAAVVAGPAAPLRPAALQGGWQSAGVARPQSPDQTALHGTPGAWPMPPVRGDAAGVQTHVGRAAPAPQQSALPPSPYPAPAQPAQPYPAQPYPAQPVQRQHPPQPAADAAAAGAGGLHHTALASDYLRAAREAALGGAMAPVAPRAIAPAAPSVESLAARAPQAPPPRAPAYADPGAYEPPGPPTQMPVSDPVPTVPPVHPVSVYPTPPSPVAAPASAPPPTAAPPATAPLSEPGPLPLPQRTYQPAVAYAPEPELLHGPRSIGTQASIAPPLHSATPAAPLAAPVGHFAVAPTALSPVAHAGAPPAAHVGMAPAPNPVRPVAPSAMAGTMLDRTPSIPGSALGAPATAPAASSAAHSATAAFATRFEQVPSARSSLAQQQTGFGLHIPIDQSASDWGRANLDQTGAAKGQGKPPSQARLIVLAALAVAAIGFAAFGKQLIGGPASSPTDGIEQRAAEDDSERPKQATLTNLPGTAQPAAPAAAAPAAVAPATAAATAAPAPVAAAAPAVLPRVPIGEEKTEPVAPADAKAAEAARKEAEAAASPESKLAADAARHVLVARYSDALPLYRQLQQSYPQNTAYAAMVRVLEGKTAPSAKGAQP